MKIILLGGVPGVGKTTISNYLAIKNGISTVINLDILKQTLKVFISNDKYLYTTSHDSYKIENLPIIESYLKYSKSINNYLLKIIPNIKDKIIIIEGVSINIDLYNELIKKYDVLYINLYSNKEDLIYRYEIKNKLRNSNWIDNISNIELINDYLISNCNINIKSKYLNRTLKEINKYVKNFLYNKYKYMYKSKTIWNRC